jgi:hypothetical protein
MLGDSLQTFHGLLVESNAIGQLPADGRVKFVSFVPQQRGLRIQSRVEPWEFLGFSRRVLYTIYRREPITRPCEQNTGWKPLEFGLVGGQVREFAPTGLEDSAQGFNPGNRPPERRALKGRQNESTNNVEVGSNCGTFGQDQGFGPTG